MKSVHFLKIKNSDFKRLYLKTQFKKITIKRLNITLKLIFYPLVITYYLGFIAKVLQKCYEHNISCNFFVQNSMDQNFGKVEFNFE